MPLSQELLEQRLNFLLATLIDNALTLGLGDDLGGRVIHLGTKIPRALNLSIVNTLTAKVLIVGQPGPPSSDNFHFRIKFVNNQCFFKTAPPTLATSNWQMAFDTDAAGFITELYLLCTETITLEAKSSPGNTTSVGLRYTETKVKNIDVDLFQVAVTVGDNVIAELNPEEPVTGTTTVHLTTFTDADVPTPLVATLVQPKTVLNHNVERSMLLRLVNTSPDPVSFAAPPAPGSPSPTAIELSVDVDDVHAWALCTAKEAESMVMHQPSDWTGDPPVIGTGRKTWLFRPDFTKTSKIDPNSVLEFTLTGVRTTLPPGFTNMYIGLREFPIYGTQTLVSQIEKSPLIYGDALGSGLLSDGTTGAHQGLALNGNTTSELLLVNQTGAGNSAHFKGGAGVKIENSLALSGTINGVTIDKGVITAAGITSNGEATVKARLTADFLTSKGQLNTAGLISTADVTVDTALTVTKQATIKGQAQVASLKADGLAEAASLKVSGSAEVGSLTVNNAATANGLLTANKGAKISTLLDVPGPVSMVGRYAYKSTNTTYTAATDGFVTAIVHGADPKGGFCCTRLVGSVSGTEVTKAQGGTMCTYKINSPSDWSPVVTWLQGSLSFPVPKGYSWLVKQDNDGWNQQNANVTVLWIPLGREQTTLAEEHEETDVVEFQNLAQTNEPDVESSIADLVGDLASVFNRDLSAEDKQRLHDRVFKLMLKQPSPKVTANYESALINVVTVLEKILKQSFTDDEKKELATAVRQLM